MLFNSIEFVIFLPIVFLIYWFVVNKSFRYQNVFLLAASYFFYACWDWRFLFLLMFSTLLDYFTAQKMSDARSLQRRKAWLWISIGINLGFLGFFKYYNFFINSFASSFGHLGLHLDSLTLNIILPVGISFYTFHGLSYVIDVYKERIKPEKNFADYALFVSFFPLLVAGPIERATHLLPQLKKERTFDYSNAVEGLRQILWGLFKKIVIADQCATYVDMMFNNTDNYSGITLAFGAVLFAFQIYGDFSGYSDIAIGVAKLFGIDLLKNFAFPYFSRDIAEFWRRWHISLSSWFRDYVYIPLGGSRGSLWSKIRNIFIIFILSGFWHGANWTFIVWGALNALYFLPLFLFGKNRTNMEIVAKGRIFPSIRELFSMLVTFGLTVVAWIFFRSPDIKHAFQYLSKMFKGMVHKEGYTQLNKLLDDIGKPFMFIILGFLLVEWIGREGDYGLDHWGNRWKRSLRYVFYYLIVIAIFWYGGKEQRFIYFQF